MRPEQLDGRQTSRRRRALSCAGYGFGAPLIAAALLALLFALNNRPPAIRVPGHGVPNPNGWDTFAKAGQLARHVVHKPPASVQTAAMAQADTLVSLAACVKENAAAHALLRQGLSQQCVRPAIRSYKLSFRANADVRELCRELLGEAEYYDRTGKPALAANALLDGAEMGAVMAHGGGIIDWMSTGSCQDICIAFLEPLMSRLDTADLAGVARRLDAIERRRVRLSETLAEDANIETAEFIEALRDPTAYRSYKGVLNLAESADTLGPRRPAYEHHLKAAGFMLANKDAIARENYDYYRALSVEAREPYTGKSRVEAPRNLIVEWFPPFYLQHRAQEARRDSVYAVLRLEVALMRYRREHGAYPKELAALTPQYLSAIPDDACAGRAGVKPVYRSPGDGRTYVLYSLGPDLRDDGGRPMAPWNYQAQTGDLVAGHLGKPWWHPPTTGLKQQTGATTK